MADTLTANYSFVQPQVGGSASTWGTKLNANWASVDTTIKAVSDKADANESAITALDFSATATTYDPAAVALTATTVQGAIDQLCTLPQQVKSGAYTLQATDAGGFVSTTAGITVSAVFDVGDVVVIYNNSASNITISRSGTVMYWVNASDANRTLGPRGVATLLCVGAGTFVITGQGLS